MTRTFACLCILLSSCKAPAPAPAPEAAVDAGQAEARKKPLAVWPPGLTDDLAGIVTSRTDADGGVRMSILAKNAEGLWMMTAPRRGEADPDAVARLELALADPQVLEAVWPSKDFREDQKVQLRTSANKGTSLSFTRPPPGQPMRVRIGGVGEFLVSPVELPQKLPDPDDFLPPGLWVSAQRKATSVEVKGKRSYRLEGSGEEWKMVKGKPGKHDLDDVPGVIIGRQAAGHPEQGVPTGLDTPDAEATLCAGSECRTFRFGHAGGRYYAQGPNADPLELRDNDWKLLVEGP